ncbi:MAG: response regulator transcription factor [Blautia sp.]|nr:response regulator transcription factor [Blautia sp.]
MIRIAIVEDDKSYAQELIANLDRYEQECGHNLVVQWFQDGEDIVEDYKCNFDIILMDVEMMFMNGMTAAEKIREIDKEVIIIFITNMPQYAIKGYMVDALDYVLKPLSYYAFSQKIDRALQRLDKRKKKFLPVSVKGGMKKLDISRIYYIEVQDHDLCFHTMDGDYEAKGSMKELELTLEKDPFYRCNKCYLVNLEHISGIQGNDLLIGGTIIQVSRSRKKELMNQLNNYMNEVSK